jgi:hypothetical protein
MNEEAKRLLTEARGLMDALQSLIDRKQARVEIVKAVKALNDKLSELEKVQS